MKTKSETQVQTTAVLPDMQKYYKVLTHDLCSPIQAGPPLFDGTCPYGLPVVALDTSDAECGAGWNCCASGADALRIAGMWPNGRSSRVFQVVPSADVLTRGDKSRASGMTILRELPESGSDGVRGLVAELSTRWFKDLADVMLREQMAYRYVLGAGFDTKVAEDIRTRAWDARGAWDARDAWDAWDAWDARDAWDALTVYYVCVLRQWYPLPSSYKLWIENGIASMLPADVLAKVMP